MRVFTRNSVYTRPVKSSPSSRKAEIWSDEDIGAQTITVLLTVAQNDGKLIVSDLERLCGLTRESASRNLTLLSGRKLKDGRHGYGLVEHRENEQDRRVKILYLTRRGQQMIQKILAAIPGGSWREAIKALTVAACLLLAGCVSVSDKWTHQDGQQNDQRWNRDVADCTALANQHGTTLPQTLFDRCMKGRGYSNGK